LVLAWGDGGGDCVGGLLDGGLPGDGDFEVAFVAAEVGGVVGLDGHAAGEGGGDAGGELEDAGGVVVDAGLAEVANGVGGGGFFAGEEAGEGEAVAADVHEGAAGEWLGEADVAGDFGGAVAEAGADELEAANGAGADGVHDGVGEGVGAVHEGFDEGAAGFFGDGEHFFGLREIGGKRLFAEDVFAGAEGFERPLVVEGVGEGDVDGLDCGVVEEGFVGAVGGGDVEGLRESAGGVRGAGGDGGEAAAAGGADAGAELAGDVAGAEDAPGERGRHWGIVAMRRAA